MRRYSERQLRFLEFHFAGLTMAMAAKRAGFGGRSDPALCNTAKRILSKFEKEPEAFFRQAGPRGLKIARLLVDMGENNKSEHKQLEALTILSKCIKWR